nr:MAG TPA: hypothetical protein [Caudoviricetes sp.]DAR27997.1 MAG TPA: hypothetical protein [Caudoviricetes sp.]
MINKIIAQRLRYIPQASHTYFFVTPKNTIFAPVLIHFL